MKNLPLVGVAAFVLALLGFELWWLCGKMLDVWFPQDGAMLFYALLWVSLGLVLWLWTRRRAWTEALCRLTALLSGSSVGVVAAMWLLLRAGPPRLGDWEELVFVIRFAILHGLALFWLVALIVVLVLLPRWRREERH